MLEIRATFNYKKSIWNTFLITFSENNLSTSVQSDCWLIIVWEIKPNTLLMPHNAAQPQYRTWYTLQQQIPEGVLTRFGYAQRIQRRCCRSPVWLLSEISSDSATDFSDDDVLHCPPCDYFPSSRPFQGRRVARRSNDPQASVLVASTIIGHP